MKNPTPALVTLGLGTNVTFRLGHIKRALNALSANLTIMRCAPIYQSDAMLKPGAPASWNQPFLNTVVLGQTSLPPEKLLTFIKRIEILLGRSPFHASWSPRTIDIDIITYKRTRLKNRRLTLPHPHINQRGFVILPLADIASFALTSEGYAHESRQIWRHAIAEGRLPSYTIRKTLLSAR